MKHMLFKSYIKKAFVKMLYFLFPLAFTFSLLPIHASLILCDSLLSSSKVGHPHITNFQHWKKIRSEQGKCCAMFPDEPEQIQQSVPISGENASLQYHVYVTNTQKVIFMLLIVQYPHVISEVNSSKNLEHFLSMLAAQNSGAKVVSADLVNVQGHEGLDFVIQSGMTLFHGRVTQANNALYLIGVECEHDHYQEDNYRYFIDSFELE